MDTPTGIWSQVELAGHVCRTYEPAVAQPAQLHGHLSPLQRGRVAAQLSGIRARVRSLRPARHRTRHRAKLVDRPHLARVRRQRFPPNRMCSTMSCPTSPNRWNAAPPQLALLGVSMGGQGALRMAYKYPNIFPTVAAISPAIDFQKRIDEGVDPGLEFMYRDAEEARQDTALLAHPSAQLAAEPVLLLRPDRLPLARLGRPAADETLARSACRSNATWKPKPAATASSTRATWPRARSVSSPHDSTKNAAAWSSDALRYRIAPACGCRWLRDAAGFSTSLGVISRY